MTTIKDHNSFRRLRRAGRSFENLTTNYQLLTTNYFMTGKTHQTIGIVAGLGFFLATAKPEYNPATLGSVLVVSHLSALLPDIDQPASQIWRTLPFGRIAGKISDPFLEHRNITHSLLGVAIFGALIFLLASRFPVYWGIDRFLFFGAAMVAYASHLLADSITIEGIPLFFPYGRMFGLPPKPFDGIRIATGKWFENLVIFPAFNLVLILLIYLAWPTLKTVIYQTH